ncbi:MAG: type II toxin-antitoxin system Phd/YefM family antitoxin [Microcystaceae cyanobacterium]
MTKTTKNQEISPSSIEEIKQQINSQLSNLSPQKIQAILEVTTYLSEQESEDATQEIREIPNIIQLLEIAESQAENGEMIDWQEPQKVNWEEVMAKLKKGEEMILCHNGVPLGKIVSYATSQEPRILGIDRGKFTIPDDFDAPLPDEILSSFEG